MTQLGQLKRVKRNSLLSKILKDNVWYFPSESIWVERAKEATGVKAELSRRLEEGVRKQKQTGYFAKLKYTLVSQDPKNGAQAVPPGFERPNPYTGKFICELCQQEYDESMMQSYRLDTKRGTCKRCGEGSPAR